jgi:adenine-specific DNA-methyltransferase
MTAKDERISKQSMDVGEFNKERLLEMFPIFRTEGGGVDFDRLKLALGESVDVGKETFGMRWPGKADSIRLANMPSHGTLSPDKKESVNFDTTQNLIIEGDNLEVLKLLRKSYQGKVNMIYIDPPYNTGNDFVYEDDFADGVKNYLQQTAQIDAKGNRLSTNSETDGRFHSNWMNMIYPRLYLAKDLLTEDGIVFVSIDDNELDHLIVLCSEIFGRENFVGTIVIEGTPKNDPDVISTAHEYCVCFAKQKSVIRNAGFGLPNQNLQKLDDLFEANKQDDKQLTSRLANFLRDLPDEDSNIKNYKYFDSHGIYRIGPIDDPQGGGPRDDRKNTRTGGICKIPVGGWRCNLKTWNEWVSQNLIHFPESDDKLPSKKTYAHSSRREPLRALQKMQIRRDTEYLSSLFETSGSIFANPKPLDLMKLLLNLISKNEKILVVDLFSGSGTLVDAAFRVNSELSKKIQIIAIQIAEMIDPDKTSSKKEGKRAEEAIRFLQSIKKPQNISEITKERVRRAGKKIIEESDGKLKLKGEDALDFGFRVLKLNESNIEDWNSEEASKSPENLLDALKTTRLKSGRSEQDVVFEVLIKYGIELTSKVEEEKAGKGSIWKIGGGDLIVIVSAGLTVKDLHSIVKMAPKVVVMLDESFDPESLKTNARAIFKDAKIELKTF